MWLAPWQHQLGPLQRSQQQMRIDTQRLRSSLLPRRTAPHGLQQQSTGRLFTLLASDLCDRLDILTPCRCLTSHCRLDAPFGTEDNPVVVPSEFSERIVGVADPDDDSLVGAGCGLMSGWVPSGCLTSARCSC